MSVFQEANSVLEYSPRASAALSRICIEQLCEHIGAKGDNLHKKIEDLVQAKSLNTEVKQMLKVVRLLGNDAVHSGQIISKDDRKIALGLLKLVNYIVDQTIGREQELEELNKLLPENKQ